jgi:hypothetical protein
MDDSGARWVAADVRARSAVRLEKRDAAGNLLWSGEWSYQGRPLFSAAVTPGGEPLFAATSECQTADPICAAFISVDVSGTTYHGSIVVKLGTDGTVRWVRSISGWLIGADADGGTALGSSRASTPPKRLIVKLNANGDTVWSQEITSLTNFHLARTGDVLVTGCYQFDQFLIPGVPCNNGVVATQLGPDGTPRWTAHVGGYWPVIDSTADGSEYAATLGGSPFLLTALSPDGNVRWTRPLGGTLFANERGEPLIIAAAANGPVAVAGYTYTKDPSGALNSSLAIIGRDASGNPTFTLTLPGIGPATAMVYGADGALLVASPQAIYEPGGQMLGSMIVELAP